MSFLKRLTSFKQCRINPIVKPAPKVRALSWGSVRNGSVQFKPYHMSYKLNEGHSRTWYQQIESDHWLALICNELFSYIELGQVFSYAGTRMVCVDKVIERDDCRIYTPILKCAYTCKAGLVKDYDVKTTAGVVIHHA
jgi:hypothetical protein